MVLDNMLFFSSEFVICLDVNLIFSLISTVVYLSANSL